MLKKLIAFTASLTILINSAAYADLAIIGHPDFDTGALNIKNVKKLFLGERKSFPNGLHATPVNHVAGSPDRIQFFSSVLGMSESGHRRNWKRKISVNAGSFPVELGSHNEVLRTIAKTPGGISYIDANKVDDTVKVLLTISVTNNQ